MDLRLRIVAHHAGPADPRVPARPPNARGGHRVDRAGGARWSPGDGVSAGCGNRLASRCSTIRDGDRRLTA